MNRAMAGAFSDLLTIIGVGAGLFAFVDIPMTTELALMALFGIALIDMWVRYFVTKRNEG